MVTKEPARKAQMHSGPSPRAEENATTCPGEKSHGSAWGPFLRAWLCVEGPPEAVLGQVPTMIYRVATPSVREGTGQRPRCHPS